MGKVIEKFLDSERKRKYNLRLIVDSIMYITKTGCQWRMLPTDFPKWQLIYYYFRQWSARGLTEQIHDSLVIKVREKSNKKADSFGSVFLFSKKQPLSYFRVF